MSSYLDILSIVEEILSHRAQILSIAIYAEEIQGDFLQNLLIMIENKRNHQPL